MFKKFIILSALILCNYSIADSNHSLIKEVEEQFLSNFDWQCESLHSNPNWSFAQYVDSCLKSQINLKEIIKARIVFNILAKNNNSHQDVIDTTTWDDLNLFRNIKNKQSVNVFRKIDRTYTYLAKASLNCMIAQPIVSIDELVNRQEILKTIIYNKELFNQLDQKFNELKNFENLFLSFFVNDPLNEHIDNQYIKFNDQLNEYEIPLNFSNSIEHNKRAALFLTRVVASVVLPIYGIYKLLDKNQNVKFAEFSERLISSGDISLGLISLIKNNEVQAIASIFAGLNSILTTKHQFEELKNNFLVLKYMQEKLIHVSSHLKIMNEISDIISKYPNLFNNLEAYKIHKFFKNNNNQKLNKLLLILQSNTFKNGPSSFSNWGKILVAYKLFNELKNDFNEILNIFAKIEVYTSIAKLFKEFEDKKVNYSFVKFIKNNTPVLNLEDFWNPILDEKSVVANSINIGTGNANNVIITGSNKGGKSTIIRSATINIILAQTFGIAAAKSMETTLFHKIGTYINITDDIAAGDSLFSAQIDRIKYLINQVRDLKSNEFWILGFDEPCTGTDYVVGQAAFYSIIKDLTNARDNNVCIISTHSKLLPKLEQENNKFKNYFVGSYQDKDNEIKSTFKLEKGLSIQSTVLSLLKAKGFDDKILTEIKNING